MLAFLYLAVLAGGTFFSVLTGARLLTERDLSVFFIPPRLLWVEAIRNLELPLWNPYYFSGHPLLAVLQPGVLYPPDILLVLLPFDLAFNWLIVLHFVAAGSFTWWLVRELGSSRTGALIAGVTFMLSGYLFSVHNVISTLFTVAWVPLLILLFLRALVRSSLLYAVLSGLVMACMFTAGGIEVFYASSVFVLCLALFPAILDFDGKRRVYPPIPRRLILLCAAAAVFLLVSAAQLFPFLELASMSTRSGGIRYQEATTWSFALKDFLQFFIPDPYGYGVTDEKYWSNQSWLKTVYTGTIPFVLSYFFLLKSRWNALPFVLVSLFAVAVALGGNNPLFRLLYDYMPFFNKFRYPVKFIFLFFLFLAVSAGLGFDRLAERAQQRPKGLVPPAMLAAATLAALVLGAVVLFDNTIRSHMLASGIDYPEYNHISINLFNAKRVIVFFILISVAVYGAFRSRLVGMALPVLVVALLSVDLFFAHNGYYASTEAAAYHEKGTVMELLDRDPGLFRVFVTPRTLKGPVRARAPRDPEELRAVRALNLDKERLTGYNVEHKLFDINGMEVMRRADYTTVYGLMVAGEAIDSTNILKMLNVKYVVSTPEITSPEFVLLHTVGFGEGAPKEAEGLETLKVYENTNYLERFYLAGGFRVVEDPSEYPKVLSEKGFDPAETVLLDTDPGMPSPGAAGQGAVEVAGYGLGRIELKVRAQGPSLLVASEAYYPGWRAYVNGERREILRANMVQRAVAVPEGESTVSFVYSPGSFRAGAAISAVTLAGLAVAGVFALGRRRAHR